MSNPIVKLTRGDKSWYLIWSTVADAPATYGMTLEELREHRRFRHAFGLVRGQHHFAPGSAQVPGNVVVLPRDAGAHIDDGLDTQAGPQKIERCTVGVVIVGDHDRARAGCHREFV